MKQLREVCIIALLFCGLLLPFGGEAADITVTEVTNKVIYNRPSDEEWPLTLQSVLRGGDSVSAGANSSATLKLDAGNIVHMDSDTKLSIDELDFNMSGTKGAFTLSSGSVLCEVNRAIGAGRYEVETPCMRVGVRGTVFWMEVGAEPPRPDVGAIVGGGADSVMMKKTSSESVGKMVGGLVNSLFKKKPKIKRSTNDNVIMLSGECRIDIKGGKDYTVKAGQVLTLPPRETEPRISAIDEVRLPPMAKRYLESNSGMKSSWYVNGPALNSVWGWDNSYNGERTISVIVTGNVPQAITAAGNRQIQINNGKVDKHVHDAARKNLSEKACGELAVYLGGLRTESGKTVAEFVKENGIFFGYGGGSRVNSLGEWIQGSYKNETIKSGFYVLNKDISSVKLALKLSWVETALRRYKVKIVDPINIPPAPKYVKRGSQLGNIWK